jgi:hypothetical protein
MSIPLRAPVEITGDEQQRLAKLHREFIAKLQGLSEQHQKAVIKATAHNITGSTDPFTQAVAAQMQEVVDINDRIAAAKAELEQIERTDLNAYRPRDPHFKGRTLARRETLEESIKADMARALAVSESDLLAARQDAVLHFRGEDAKAAKAKAILDMRDSIRAEAEQRELEARARALVNSERLLAGQPPLPDADAKE